MDPAHCLRPPPLHWDNCHRSADVTDTTMCSHQMLKSSNNMAVISFAFLYTAFTSPVLCAFLLARACLLSLRSLAHRSVSLSPALASTAGTKPDSGRFKSENQTSHRLVVRLRAPLDWDARMACTSPVRCRRAGRAGGLREAQQVGLLQTGDTRPPADFLRTQYPLL